MGTADQKQYAVGALHTLAGNDHNKVAIAQAGGIPPLVALMRDGDDAQKQSAAGALHTLAGNDYNKILIAQAKREAGRKEKPAYPRHTHR